MKKILIYGLYLLVAAVLTAGCIKDEAAAPALRGGDRLTLQLPESQQVAVTRAATAAECRIGSLYVLVYRGGALAHKQAFAAAAVSGNGTAQPFVDLDYSLRANDKVCVAANYPASVGTSLQGLADGSAESGLASLLVYDNPVCGRAVPASEAQPMYGSVVWSAGSNTCSLVRSLAKVSVETENSAVFAGKTVTYILAGAPEKTSMEVRYDTSADKYEIPDAAGIGGAWSTAIDAGGMISLSEVTYSAAYPLSGVAGGAAADLNTFDKRRTALILCATDAADAKEYYRLDFSRQLSSTSITGDASNEYLDIEPNTHYTFRITSVKSGGYLSAAEAWKNPGSNIEYTVTVSDSKWISSTSNGQYLVKSDRDSVLVVKNMATAAELLRFACQMPDAGQKPGGDLPGSVETRTVTLVGADRKTPVSVSKLQLCKSDGTPAAGNTFDFSGEIIPDEGYLLKYLSGSSLPDEAVYARVRYGNVEHYVPLLPLTFDVTIPTTTFSYAGATDRSLQVQSHYYDARTDSYAPCPWTAEFSTDGGVTWTASQSSMLSRFPAKGAGSDPRNLAAYPADYKFNVLTQTGVSDNSHNEALAAAKPEIGVYDLSTKGGTEPMNTANCYVVNAPGTYTLPLVYGNAVKNGGIHSAAYTSAVSGNYIITNFVNHLDARITDPYIYNNAGCTPAGACLVWQDAYSLVTSVELTPDGKYLRFDVDHSTIRQGNAVVAVLDASGMIMWSWHIWVTDYVPGDGLKKVTNYQGYKYDLLPVYVGWCDPETLTYDARSIKVRFTQTRTGLARDFTMAQQPHSVSYSGNQPYFQFGRKDPMLPGVRTASGDILDKSAYYDDIKYMFYKSGQGKVSLGGAIRNPHVFFNYGGTGILDWCATSYYNVWSADNTLTTGNDNKVVKTVYDPSPVGFCMPASNAFTGYTYNGQVVIGDYYGSRYNSPYNSAAEFTANSGWEFYCNRMFGMSSFDPSGGTIFCQASGFRDYTSGSVFNIGSSGYCWTAVPYNLSYGMGLYFYESQVHPWYNYYRSYGFPAHVVKE